MKKRILVVAAVFATSMAFGQDLTSKKGETMLPEEGDYAIGFDADPFLNYVGNFLNSGATAPSADWATTDLSIMGKMFKDAQTAYRGRIRLGFGNTSTTMNIDSATVSPTPSYYQDVMKTSYNAITLGGGLEMRRGNTRVQGLYGGEALISMSGSKTTNEYGVALSDNFPMVGRVLEDKAGSTVGFTLRGFAGVELFVFPKTSIAFEYGWGLMVSSTGEGERTEESWTIYPNETAASLHTETYITDKSSSFGIDTDNSGGRLTILFHF